ncbi:MAG TPA: CoA-transferase, partial [Acidimicrobiales bacterium]|nr:CoA-transferase [Acidimicrobiales bacterium]
MEHLSLEDAVRRHVRAGDTVHVACGHSRWTAAARELARQHWGVDAGFTLVMVSLSTLGSLFFRGGMVRRVVTAYSGDTFPTYTPNPWFQDAYRSGAVEVEHWSILTFTQRLEAAARGLPALVTGSLEGSSMADNDGYARVDTPFGTVGLVAPLTPDVTLVHGAVADVDGNVALSEPLLEGTWGAWAARRGVIATVEAVVPSLEGLGTRVRIPAHRVVAVVEAPFGAHPGGLYAPGLPVASYGEDIPFWSEARQAGRDDPEGWDRQWVLEPTDQDDYLRRVGAERLQALQARSDPESWRADEAAHPVDPDEPVSKWERSAVHGVREVRRVVDATDAHAVLAGAGVANLAAWVAVVGARAAGSRVVLTAELGMLGYLPTPADPYIFNHRSFPGTDMLSDASTVLGMVVGGPGTRTVACLGAAQVDRHGNLNSTTIPGGPFLVGSGGANDVASRAAACVVVGLARPDRLVAEVGYVTSPGARVTSIVTDRGVLRRVDGSLRIAAVASGPEPVESRVRAFADACGWDPEVVRDV